MLKRKNTRRQTSCSRNAETVEPRIVLSAIQPVVVDSDVASLKESSVADAKQANVKLASKVATVADSVESKAVMESTSAKAVGSNVESQLDVKVADHLQQDDLAAQGMMGEKELLNDITDSNMPETELSGDNLKGRRQVGQDDAEMTFTDDEVEAAERMNEAEDAANESEFYLIASGAVEVEDSDSDAERAMQAAEEAAAQVEAMTKLPKPDEADSGTGSGGEHDPDREDLAPGVGDPQEAEEEDSPTVETGNLDVGNTNWGEGNDGPMANATIKDAAAQRVIDVYIETLGGKINPLPVN